MVKFELPEAPAVSLSTENVSKKGKKNKKAVEVEVNQLQGLTSSEINMIRKLAGNDPQVRKMTMLKLRKWLIAIVKRVPDSCEAREMIEPNFIRVWKALFYCMWMADKPLPQEALAEQISNLTKIFSSKPTVLILFFEWFIITFGREWSWIDRLRMDKFMMLIRRFIRKTFEELSASNWSPPLLTSFNSVISTHLFNHFDTKDKSNTPMSKCPLGFQIHVVDVFCEELGKVGGGEVNSSVILELLSPFIHEMGESDDERLLGVLKERVFHYLMRQSDVGIDYEESKGGLLEFVEEEESEEQNSEEEESEEEEDERIVKKVPLDPRAGAVDVVIPQLVINYNDLVQRLVDEGGLKTTRSKNRKMLYGLAKQFISLTKGNYPLGYERDDSKGPPIKNAQLNSAARRLIRLEESLKEARVRKRKRDDATSSKVHLDGNIDGIEFDFEQNSDEEEIGKIGPEISTPKRKKLKKGAIKSGEEEISSSTPSSQKPKKTKKTQKNTDEVDSTSVQIDEEIESPQKRAKAKKHKIESSNESPQNGALTKKQKVKISKEKHSPQNGVKIKKQKIEIRSESQSPQNGTPTKKQKTERSSESPQNGAKNKIKKKKAKNSQSPDQSLNEEITKIESPNLGSPKNLVRKKLGSKSPQIHSPKELSNGSPNNSFVTPFQTPLSSTPKIKSTKEEKARRRQSLSKNETNTQEEEGERYVEIKVRGKNSLKKQMNTPSPKFQNESKLAKKTLTPATPSSAKKRVKIVLQRNLEHEHSDYQESILRSPALPFDSKKRPSFGLLKSSPMKSPAPALSKSLLQKSTLSNNTQNIYGSESSKRSSLGSFPTTPRKRARASDFF